VPIAIDFCNPAPDADIKSVGQENFDWVVETTANYAIERAKAQKPGQDNLTWGEYIKASVAGKPLIAKTTTKAGTPKTEAPKVEAPKAAAAKAAAPKAKVEKAPAKPKAEPKAETKPVAKKKPIK